MKEQQVNDTSNKNNGRGDWHLSKSSSFIRTNNSGLHYKPALEHGRRERLQWPSKCSKGLGTSERFKSLKTDARLALILLSKFTLITLPTLLPLLYLLPVSQLPWLFLHTLLYLTVLTLFYLSSLFFLILRTNLTLKILT